MSPRAVLVLALAPLSATACGPEAPPAPSWPPGTVLAVDERPILPDEIDEVASWIAVVEPEATPLRLQRLALTNTVFPRVAARALSDGRWEAARAEAEAERARLEGAGDEGDEAGEEVSGSWQQLGFECFGAALQADGGRWSDVIESPGCFHLVRLEEASEDGVVLELRRLDFRYLPEGAEARIDGWLDGALLTIVDEAWRDAVPLSWVYRMRGGRS